MNLWQFNGAMAAVMWFMHRRMSLCGSGLSSNSSD